MTITDTGDILHLMPGDQSYLYYRGITLPMQAGFGTGRTERLLRVEFLDFDQTGNISAG